ncbi:MAG: hypothetical protein ABI425_04015 [Patescibacteria group bacterium]
MKRLPPHSLQGKLWRLLERYWLRFLSILLWLLTVGFLTNAWSQRPQPEPMTTECLVKSNVKKGDYLQLNKITSKQIRTHDISSNSINDCNNVELTKIPLLIDLQAGDILQLSSFQKPEELVTLKEQIAPQQHLFYLPLRDLHAIPSTFETGQELSILGKDKKADQAEILIESVKVADVTVVKTDSDQEQINSVGFVLDPQTSLLLTKALADGWYLVAITK